MTKTKKSRPNLNPLAVAITTALSMSIMPVYSAQDEGPDQATEVELEREQDEGDSRGVIDTMVVTARRSERSISSIPNSISVIGLDELEDQFAVDDSLNSLLQFSVPGIAAVSQTIQSPAVLRGRTALILVDGVPQNQLLRSSGFDINTIGADAIERVEVIRGANAVFGFGATGGVINFITKRPTDEPGFEVFARARTSFQTSEPEPSREIYLQATGRADDVGVLLGISVDDTEPAYDGNGDLIPNVSTEQGKKITNIHGSIDWDISAEQYFQLTANRYSRKDVLGDTAILESFGDPATGEFSSARFGDAFYTDYDAIYYGTPEVDPSTLPFELVPGEQEYTNATATYEHSDILGSKFQATALYHRYPLTFPFFRFLELDVSQERLRKRTGLRTNVDTPLDNLGLPVGTRVVWGADWMRNSVDEGDNVGGPDGVVKKTRTTQRVTPWIEQDTIGIFGQIEVPLGQFLLSGGVRYENYDITMLDAEFTYGGFFEGGEIDYDEVVFNAGLVYYANPALDLYMSFTQGLDVTQVGRAAFQVESAALIDPEAAVTDSWEIGARSDLGSVRLEAAAFYSDSELASRTQPVAAAGGFALPLRQPEEIWGLEGSVSAQVSDRLSLGGTFTWNDGERKLDDGGAEPLQNYFLSPTTLTGYANWSPLRWLNTRLQVVHTFSSDDFEPGAGFGRGDFENLTLVDASVSIVNERWGQFDLGFSNLFNEVDVAPGERASNLGFNFIAIPGRTVSLSYSYRFQSGR